MKITLSTEVQSVIAKIHLIGLIASVAWLVGCAAVSSSGPRAQAPEAAYRSIASMPATQAAVTANPLATRAALKMLEAGGSSIDGAIAAQMVLGLVEPQSSGIGGGSLIMYWDAATKKLTSFDGLAAAPARVTTALTVDLDGTLLRSADMARGGRTVGVPGTLAVLKQVHERYGKLPWARLFSPAIELAESGFAMPNYLHEVLTGLGDAKDHPDLAQIFFDAGGKVLPVGSKLTNPAYAKTLRRVAEMGPVGLWQGDAGATLLALAQHGYRPSLMTEADFSAYSPKLREPVCAPFLAYSVCSMAPASFGGVMVLQILQMLEARTGSSSDLTRFDFDNSEFVHYYAEAGRLAQADRLHYIGDPDFVRVPTLELVAGQYLRNRARLIDPLHTTMDVKAGDLTTGGIALESAALSEAADATSQLAIVDAQGSALSMTTTINLNFGSHLMVDGFVLNNALTNFSSAPRSGEAAPNRMQGGKRPVTSMAPTIVFDKSGQPIVVGGSAGGGQIVDYICTSLVEMLANQRSPAEAVSKGHVSTASRGKLQLEKGSAAAAQAVSLAAKGHHIEIVPMVSGLGFLKRRDTGWIGAADPRRDGVALGR